MTTIAVLGTGIMGFSMARNLLDAGHAVRAWNRTIEKARPLADDGATVAATAAEAVEGADIILTMLADGSAVEQVMRHAGPAAAEDTLWIQTSTVGARWADRLEDDARQFEVGYVDAPVLGTKGPAEQGDLIVLASGPTELRAVCEPIFDAVGKRTMWLGEAGVGSRVKVVVNAWLVGLVGALAESIALAEALDLDPRAFLDVIRDGPVGAPYADIKGSAMIENDYTPSFPLKHALKDARLVLEAASGEGLRLKLAEAVAERFADAVDAGQGDEDMSAVRRVAGA